MDAFGDLLRAVRANGAVIDRSILTSPWALRFDDGPPLTLCTVLRGEGWLTGADAEPRRLRPGDTAVVRGPAGFTVADRPDRDPDAEPPCDVRIGGDGAVELGTAAAPPGNGGPGRPAANKGHGRPAENGGPQQGTALLLGAYQLPDELGGRLLRALPPVLVVPDDTAEECGAALDVIAAEAVADRPGQQVVLDRLLDWLLVCTLRAWFDRPEGRPPSWYSALGDPVVGAALRALHDAPAAPWTVAALAAEAGVSRAALAKRFTELVGEPPLSYLTGWRMSLAAELLAEPRATVATVARRVGYADGFAFSAAFKRSRGVSPSAHRAAVHSG